MEMIRVKLENKIAVVTGGAMGNGAGIVEVFAKYKARVIKLIFVTQIVFSYV